MPGFALVSICPISQRLLTQNIFSPNLSALCFRNTSLVFSILLVLARLLGMLCPMIIFVVVLFFFFATILVWRATVTEHGAVFLPTSSLPPSRHFFSWNVKSWKMMVTYYIYPLPISLMPCGWNWDPMELDGGVIFFLGQLMLLHFGFPRKMVFGWTFDFFTFKEKNQPHGLRPEDLVSLHGLLQNDPTFTVLGRHSSGFQLTASSCHWRKDFFSLFFAFSLLILLFWLYFVEDCQIKVPLLSRLP